jgi:UDP-N-acetylglucosamine:LPS N-acetylglucosamine transferase
MPSRTVLSNEHKTDKTTCLSGHVAIYVMALTPFTGRMPVCISMEDMAIGPEWRTG